MFNKTQFYDHYHAQNSQTSKIISPKNFTYYSITDCIETNNLINKCSIVCDVGCGVGTLPLYYSEKSKFVVGIDVSKRAIELANYTKKINNIDNCYFIRKDLSQLAVREGPIFNVIIATEIIEHVEDDDHLLKVLNGLMKRNGKLLLSTQIRGSCFERWGYFKKFDLRVGHLRRYDAAELLRKIEKNGFVVISHRQVDGPLRSLLFTTRLGVLLRFIRGPFVEPAMVIDAILGRAFGFIDVQVIATKSASANSSR